jgi:NADPH-dependent glutamate synthase beta subunit-like oxidoreductase
LSALGHEVNLFEKEKFLAGTVAQEIPEFKIPPPNLKKELGEMDLNRIRIHLGVRVDRNLLEREIGKQHDAVFLGVGLSRSKQSELRGRRLKNVFDASHFLNSVKGRAIRRLKGICVTVGGGDTALDCARTALRLGAQRSILAYRRSRKEMPAAKAEIRQALEEGVEFLWQVTPVRLLGREQVREIEFARTHLVSSRPGERKRFKEARGTKLTFPADIVVFALGKDRDDTMGDLPGKRAGGIDPETLQIGRSKYFAGGDFRSGGRTVVEAVADGRRAARSIDKYLNSV